MILPAASLSMSTRGRRRWRNRRAGARTRRRHSRGWRPVREAHADRRSRSARSPASYRRPEIRRTAISRAPFGPGDRHASRRSRSRAIPAPPPDRDGRASRRCVPRLRVCRWPTCSSASCMIGQRARTSVGEFEIALARHGADLERAARLADVGQALHAVEIDDVIGLHEAHVEHRHQRLPARRAAWRCRAAPSSPTASLTVFGS